MPMNLRLEGNFLELAKNLFTGDVKVSTEYFGKISKVIDDIV